MGDRPEEKEVNDKGRDNTLVLRHFSVPSFLLPTCLSGINMHRFVYFFPLKKVQGDHLLLLSPLEELNGAQLLAARGIDEKGPPFLCH